MTRKLKAIAALDILPDGSSRPVEDDWPAAAPGEGAVWRWLHCDRTDAAFSKWAEAHLPKPARSGLLEAESRPRCDAYEDGLILALRAMNMNKGQESEDMVALRLWVTPHLVVTTRFRRVFLIEEIRRDIAHHGAPFSTGAFVTRLADGLVARIETASGEREDATDAVEEELLDDKPDAIGAGETAISRLLRSVIKLRRHIAPQREALTRLSQIDTSVISANDRFDLRDIAQRAVRTVEELDGIRDRLTSLRAHVDSLHAARMGRNGFLLSVIAAIFLPLGFLTGLFGVNVAGMPGAAWPWAFEVLSGAMVAIGVALWLVFRWLRWF
jgi:zinc transporter